MKAWQSISLIFASLLLAGCSELGTLPTQAPDGASVPRKEAPKDAPERVISPDNVPPDDVPDEFIGHATWLDVSVDVGWMSPNQSYAQSIVRYWASNATANIELKVRNNQGVQVGENSANAQAWWRP